MRELSRKEENEAKQAMRRKCIAMLMAWKPGQFGAWNGFSGRYEPNMPKVYDWINTYGHAKPKWLNKYTYSELVKLVSQIKKITTTKAEHEPKITPTQPQPRDQRGIRVPEESRA